MRIFRVSATYGELRSTGYPAYSNTRHEVTLWASLEEGETPRGVAVKLHEMAKKEVKARFGDKPENITDEMELPYIPPAPKGTAAI